MNYVESLEVLQKEMCNVKWGDSYSGPPDINRAALQEMVPRRQTRWEGPLWTFDKVVPQIGEWVTEPNTDGPLIGMTYRKGPYYKKTLDSIKPYWDKLLVIDKSGEKVIPRGNYGLLRTNVPLSFAESQNWLMMYCNSLNIQHYISCHSDIVVTKLDVLERLVGVATQAHVGVVTTSNDIFALYNLPLLNNKVGYFDEQFPWYYTDTDLFLRMSIRRVPAVELSHHGILHEVNGTTKAMSREERIISKAETDKARVDYIKKWGGNHWDERYMVPYNQR